MICTNTNATWDGAEHCLTTVAYINYWQGRTPVPSVHYLCEYCYTCRGEVDPTFKYDRYEQVLYIDRWSEEHIQIELILLWLWQTIERLHTKNGRHEGLRSPCLIACRFESDGEHERTFMANVEKISKYSRGWRGAKWVKRQTSKLLRRLFKETKPDENGDIDSPTKIREVTYGWSD